MINEIACKEFAKKILANIKETIHREGLDLTLSIIRVGDDPSSVSYAKQIMKYCEEIDVNLNIYQLAPEVTTEDVIAMIDLCNSYSTGIMVQMPLPAQVDARAVVEAIPPEKDIDGITTTNMGKLASNSGDYFVPCTAKAVIRILETICTTIDGLDVAVFGRSNVVGKPLALELMNRNATVQVLHSHTRKDAINYTFNKDVVVTAMGQPHLLGKDDICGDVSIIVDCGVTVVNGKLQGDVDLDSFDDDDDDDEILATPVPGGVGAMTTAMLMENLVEAYHHMEDYED